MVRVCGTTTRAIHSCPAVLAFRSGIGVAFVSNNNKERVETFNNELGFIAFSKAKKPFKKNVLKAIEMIGSTPDRAMIMGDQVFTDVWAAKNAKIRSALV